MKARIVLLAIGVAALLVGGVGFAILRSNGFSTRNPPTSAEQLAARAIRRWSVPAAMRSATNPVAFSPDVWTAARAHFADHCATCHANDGGGDTEIGRSLYPRAPDMRLAATQKLTDGEIYWIIENGIRLTGMPAWGDGSANDIDTWTLVLFIRHLKHLTPEDLTAMKALNPKSPSEIEEEREDQQFLSGDDAPPPAPEPVPEHHH